MTREEIYYAAGAVDAQPQPALTHAATTLLKAGWGEALTPVAGPPALLVAVRAYDVIGASMTGAPPTFGRFDNCMPERRCPGCAYACGDEIALVQFAERRQRPLLLFLAGVAGGLPRWLSVLAVDPGRNWSGRIYRPVLYRDPQGLSLGCDDEGKPLVAGPKGLSATEQHVGTQWQVHAFDRALKLFTRAIPLQSPAGPEALGTATIVRQAA